MYGYIHTESVCVCVCVCVCVPIHGEVGVKNGRREREKKKERRGKRAWKWGVLISGAHLHKSCPAVYHHSQVRVSCSLACDALSLSLCVCVCPALMPAAVTKVKTRVAFLLLRFPSVPLYRNLPTLLFCRFDVSLTNNAAVLKSFNTCATLNSYLTISPSSHSFLTLNSVRVVFAFACDWNARFLTSSCSASSLRLHNCSPCKFKLKWQKSRKLFSLALQSPWFYCLVGARSRYLHCVLDVWEMCVFWHWAEEGKQREVCFRSVSCSIWNHCQVQGSRNAYHDMPKLCTRFDLISQPKTEIMWKT